MIKKIVFVLVFFIISLSLTAQLSKIHYIPAITGETVGDQWLYISTPSIGSINVTIKPIGGTRSDWITKAISNDNPWIYSVGSGNSTQLVKVFDTASNSTFTDAGFIVESSNLIYVSFRLNSPANSSGNQWHAAAYVSKGSAALGTRFRTATFTNTPSSGGENFISIFATEDNTKITIDDLPAGTVLENYTGSFPIEITLQKYGTYILGHNPSFANSTAIKQALIGALVISEDALGSSDPKPVVVTCGSIGGSLMNGEYNNQDYGMDQITGIDRLGDEYVFVKGYALDEIEKVILIADRDGTEIYKDGSPTPYTTLNAGEHVIFEGTDYSNDHNIYIKTQDPSFKLVAYQGIGYDTGGTAGRANQGLVFVPPLSCSSRGNIDNIPYIDYIGNKKFEGGTLTILTEDGADLKIYKNGILYADNSGTSGLISLPSLSHNVIGKPGYKTYFLISETSTNISGIFLQGDIKVTSDKELYLASSTFGGAASAGSYYSGFVSNPQVVPNLIINPLGVCISSSGVSNVELTTSSSFDSYQWLKYDTTSSAYVDAPVNPNDPTHTNDSQNYKPIEPGTYKLRGKLACFDQDYFSEEQTVSICPTDFDEDGIIDNLDLDLDNDGILNAEESLGSANIDLSDIYNPDLILPTVSFRTSGLYSPTTTSTFEGTSAGTFKSKIVPIGVNETATYKINPLQYDDALDENQRLNIFFTEDSSVSHVINSEESFSIEVYPSNKNITVIDPGERLLVNNGSGFVVIPPDGFSGNKVIFKYNTNPLDPNAKFEFYAYDIEGFLFSHIIGDLAVDDSNFHGKFQILDYNLDTDSDGKQNMYDLDSDGDGCNDIIESDLNFDNTVTQPRVNLDPNSDGIYGDLTYGASGTDVIQFPDVDSRGRINDLLDATSGTYNDPPLDPVTSNPLYLDDTAPDVIINTEPSDIQICKDGDDATFTIDVDPGTGYKAFFQWVVDKGTGVYEILIDDPATTPNTTSKDLTVLAVDSSMNGWKYSVLIYSDGVLCQEQSNEAVLKVEATLPTAKAIALADPLFDENWIIKCDDGSDQYDGISSFNLSLIDSYILDGQDPADFEVSYFLDAADALSPTTTGITNPTTFTNIPDPAYDPASPTTQTLKLHVRVRNINSNCLADPMSFDLTINSVPLLAAIADVEQCNDTVFDLEALQPSLSINAATETFEFFDSNGILITDPSNYIFSGSIASNGETITVEVKNSATLGSGCSKQTTFTIRLGACDIPTTFPVLDEALCETSTDPLGGDQDGIETFDKSIFANVETDLITAEPLFAVFGTEINFFRSDAEATAGTANVIDKTIDYTTNATDDGFTFNTTENRWEQEIWVRVENTTLAAACFDTKQVAILYINKLPELLTATVDVNQCDVGIFNLRDQEDNLSSNYADESFEYYDSVGNLITDPANYTAAGLNETITVIISTTPSLGIACVNTTASINLAWSVTILPSTYILKDEYLIETDPDPKGQAQDGIETFDKTIFVNVETDLITAEPLFAGKTFSFYRSQRDALTSFGKIDTTVDFATDPSKSGFTFNATENRWEQEIWVYVEDSVTTAIATCYGLYQIATLYVEKRPVFYDVILQESCDEQTPLDMYSEFDTSSLFSEFTTDPTGTVLQDTNKFKVEYTYVDNTGTTVTLGPTLPTEFNTTDQTITVTLTNKTTNSALTAGVSTGTIEFKVYEQPVAYPSDPAVAGLYTFAECDDVASGADDDGKTVFDMSTIKTLLLTDLSGTYVAQNPNNFDFEFSVAGSPITLGSNYTAITGDKIDVTITNPLFTTCAETITISFTVNPLPSFDIDDDTVVCLNPLPGQPVEIGTSNWNGGTTASIYNYYWTLDSDPSFNETTETIFVNTGGVYTVVVENPVTLCTREKSITVSESEMASLDLDDDGSITKSEYDHFIQVVDLANDNANTITINNISDLGIGKYEFALDDAFGPYQDDPVFNDIKPGIHTLYIRDKNSYYIYDYGCGIASIDVSIIGYRKYFTPNGDGINDTWKILGIRKEFNGNSKVYIFDRHGKLLKELDPLSTGWDGTSLGKPMPATDYWFRTLLEDGREFKGHFSLIRGKFN